MQVWREEGLGALVTDVIGDRVEAVPAADVITALVLQRCVAPDSKLAASRWFPTTALPELLGIHPDRFNNSRVHRALSAIEAAEDDLQARLPRVLQGRHGPPTALLIDATDTWFVGHGPPLAKKGVDKLGLYRRKVGIVLLCDQQGIPLRWHTLDGRFHDPTALGDMAEQAAGLPWARDVPVVVDRALGNAGWVEKLDRLGLRYVTCVPAGELESCGAPVPWDLIDSMQACTEPDQVAANAQAAGFVAVSKRRLVLDLGSFDKLRPKDGPRISQAAMVVHIIEAIEAASTTMIDLAKHLGLSTRALRHYGMARTLTEEIRDKIIAGEADALGLSQLIKIAARPAHEQAAALQTALAATPQRTLRARRMLASGSLTLSAKGALALNPERLLADRERDEEKLARVRATTADVNRRLASPRSRRTDASALAEVFRQIKRTGLGCVCSIHMDRTEPGRLGGRQVVLDVDDAAWKRRRRSDGLSLVVTHPRVEGTAIERVEQYFAKDAVEKDFQSIKSLLGLRPVRHRTDPKLRAHVTVCILGLLLHRLIEARLAQTGCHTTAKALIEQLQPARLNLIQATRTQYYTVTDPGKDNAALLATLAMKALVNDHAVEENITPR